MYYQFKNSAILKGTFHWAMNTYTMAYDQHMYYRREKGFQYVIYWCNVYVFNITGHVEKYIIHVLSIEIKELVLAVDVHHNYICTCIKHWNKGISAGSGCPSYVYMCIKHWNKGIS